MLVLFLRRYIVLQANKASCCMHVVLGTYVTYVSISLFRVHWSHRSRYIWWWSCLLDFAPSIGLTGSIGSEKVCMTFLCVWIPLQRSIGPAPSSMFVGRGFDLMPCMHFNGPPIYIVGPYSLSKKICNSEESNWQF